MYIMTILVDFLESVSSQVIIAGQNDLRFWFTVNIFFCSIIVFLLRFTSRSQTIHHMMLEKKGEII